MTAWTSGSSLEPVAVGFAAAVVVADFAQVPRPVPVLAPELVRTLLDLPGRSTPQRGPAALRTPLPPVLAVPTGVDQQAFHVW